MTPDDRRLRRHLVAAVAMKALALLILWWLFFHGHRPALDDPATTMSDHILGVPPRQGEPL